MVRRCQRVRSRALVAAVLVPVLVPWSGAAQSFATPAGDAPVRLEAGDNMAWDGQAGTVTLSGGARMSHGPWILRAARLTGYRADGGNATGQRRTLARAVASGDVVAQASRLTVTGARSELDLTAYRVTVAGAPARFELAAGDGGASVTGRAGERLVYDGPALTLTLRGGARVAQAPYRLSGETITARFDPGPDAQTGDASGGWPPAPAKLARVEAEGRVELAGPQGTVEGRRGVYDRAEQRVAVLGDVVLARGGNRVTGDAAILDLATQRARITGRGDGRVRAVVQPDTADTGAPE